MIEMKTANEALERLEALESLVRRMAVDDIGVHEAFAEAKALAPEPVDPDEAVADEIHSEWLDNSDGTRAVIMKALKRGRALERGEAR
jgi:hypothetical protein